MRTCHELGVCQFRQPACDGQCAAAKKPAPYAPGVIQGPYRLSAAELRQKRERRAAAGLAVVTATLLALVIGFSLGYFNPLQVLP